MADNNYSLKLSASINAQEITTQLDSIAKAYSFKMRVSLDSSEVKASVQQVQSAINSVTGSNIGAGKIIKIDVSQAEQKLAELKTKLEKTLQTPVNTKIDYAKTDGVETGAKAVLTYKNEIGEVVAETYKWKDVDQAWANSRTTELNDEIKLTQQLAAENDAMSKKVKDYSVQANSFLEKSKNMSPSNKQVSQGNSIAKQMQDLVKYNEATGTYSTTNIEQLGRLSDQLKPINSAVGALGKSTQSWSKEIGIAIKRTIEWSIGIGAVYGAMNQLKEGIGYIKELNKEMTNIQLVTGMSNEDIGKLTTQYTALAKSLGSTTLEVTKGALEFQRQGKTVEETTQLLTQSTMLSKLGNLSAADATEKLTSTLNGFQFSASESGKIIDKLVQLDNNFATSTGEIAEALSRSAVSAKIAGVSFDELASYIK